MDYRIVHVLMHGRTYCGMPGPASDWPPGHRWISVGEVDRGTAEVTCRPCREAYQREQREARP